MAKPKSEAGQRNLQCNQAAMALIKHFCASGVEEGMEFPFQVQQRLFASDLDEKALKALTKIFPSNWGEE